jgi:hypothetical protein
MNDTEKLEVLLAFVQDEDRVCPMPIEWNEFWKSLPGANGTHAAFQATAPFVLSAWWGTANEQKAERLRVQIKWAADSGAIDAADKFLRALPLKAWHHSDTGSQAWVAAHRQTGTWSRRPRMAQTSAPRRGEGRTCPPCHSCATSRCPGLRPESAGEGTDFMMYFPSVTGEPGWDRTNDHLIKS